MPTKLLLACCLLGCLVSAAQKPASGDTLRREIIATPIQTSLHIDGLLNEPEWALAQPSPRFIQVEPVQDAAPAFETIVKVLYNRQHLYLGIFAKDSLGKKAIRATDFKRDFNFLSHDLVLLTFDGFNDQRNAMGIGTNAWGVQRDFLSFDDLYFDIDWNGLWNVRTARTDSGWFAEFEIPWQ
ncbi:MAG: carbohydrate binding family 9 domain-containing protein, partial [Bacteroidota bacterium]|nr:carbohydrate binding family 9 domain-containing protein [Bacteroidota bacterium]